jgi:hypothetical protein
LKFFKRDVFGGMFKPYNIIWGTWKPHFFDGDWFGGMFQLDNITQGTWKSHFLWLGNLRSLTKIALEGCSSLTTLPKGLGNFTSLIKNYLWGWFCLTTMTEEVENRTSLMKIDFGGCSSLTTLPEMSPYEVSRFAAFISLIEWRYHS